MSASSSNRLLRAEQAASYLAMAKSTFLRKVKDGALPQPVRLGDGLVAWDRHDLDQAVDRLKGGKDAGEKSIDRKLRELGKRK